MSRDTTDLASALSPLLEARGLDLVDVEVHGAQLTVFVDREGGVGLDELGEATRDVSAALDELDPMPGRYTLSVSSPGLERRLRTPAHFARAVGEIGHRAGRRGDIRTSAASRGGSPPPTTRGAPWPGPRCRAASCVSGTTRSSGRGQCSSGGRSHRDRNVRG